MSDEEAGVGSRRQMTSHLTNQVALVKGETGKCSKGTCKDELIELGE